MIAQELSASRAMLHNLNFCCRVSLTHSFAVISESIHCWKLDSLGYIFVLDSMGLTLSMLT